MQNMPEGSKVRISCKCYKTNFKICLGFAFFLGLKKVSEFPPKGGQRKSFLNGGTGMRKPKGKGKPYLEVYKQCSSTT